MSMKVVSELLDIIHIYMMLLSVAAVACNLEFSVPLIEMKRMTDFRILNN